MYCAGKGLHLSLQTVSSIYKGEIVNISPLDIRKHEFRKGLRGYDVDEVAAFLDMVSIEYENLVRENAQLEEKLSGMDNQLVKYRDIENTLRETLLSAQRAREDTISTAKKQSEVIIREAEVKASSIIEEGRNMLSRLRNSFSELKIHKDSYLTKIKALTKAQLETLEQFTFAEEELLAIDVPAPVDNTPVELELKKTAPPPPDPDAPLSRETFFPDGDDNNNE